MKKPRHGSVLVVAIVVTIMSLSPLPGYTAVPSRPAMASPAQIQRSIDRYVSGIPGSSVVVGVIDHGSQRVYFAGRVGTADAAPTERTLYQIGSITKTFTATLLATLVVDGTVALDAPIQRYLPPGVSAPTYRGVGITLGNLAEQNSGLPRLPTNFAALDPSNPYASYTPTMLDAFLSNYRLSRAPGTTDEYSNLGYGLLGDLLGRALHEGYSTALEQRVLAPLGLHDTGDALTPTVQARLAPGFTEEGTATPPWTFGDLGAAGDLYSDMHDMLRYLRANLAAPLGIEGPALALATRPHAADNSGGITKIGLAWEINMANGNIFHNGQVGGYHAFMAFNRARKRGIVLLASVADMGADTLAVHILAPSLVATPQPPGAQAGAIADPAVTARAQDWLHRLATGTVDRSELTSAFSATITPALLSQTQAGLAAIGEPLSWTYLGSRASGAGTVYSYRVRFASGTHVWSIVLQADGKLAGSWLQ